MAQDVLYHELLEALQAEGCAVCRLAHRASNRYLHALIYEGVTDVQLREALRESRGLCHRHGWRMAGQRGSVLGTAIIYRDVINTLTNMLEAGADLPSRPFRRGQPELARALAPAAECPACLLERDAEQRAAKILLNHVTDAAIAEAYRRAGGLCVPHLRLALSHASLTAAKTLAAWQTDAWRRLRGELDELIRKHDYRFHAEPITEKEAHAWERAVAAATGEAESSEDR